MPTIVLPTPPRPPNRLARESAACIFEETGELVGCEHAMGERTATPELGAALIACVQKAIRYHAKMGYGSFSRGTADGDPRFGFPNINDTSEIVEMIACGAYAVIFVTGRGSVVGSAISPSSRSAPIPTPIGA